MTTGCHAHRCKNDWHSESSKPDYSAQQNQTCIKFNLFWNLLLVSFQIHLHWMIIQDFERGNCAEAVAKRNWVKIAGKLTNEVLLHLENSSAHNYNGCQIRRIIRRVINQVNATVTNSKLATIVSIYLCVGELYLWRITNFVGIPVQLNFNVCILSLL